MTTVQSFNFSVDLLRALLWQYEDAEGVQSILSAKADWYETNQTDFWTDWRRDVFDLTTANEFGCSVWAVILGVPLNYELPSTGGRLVWGFGIYNSNFNNSNFGRDASGTQALTLEQKRLVLRLRYFQLVSDGTVPHTNFVLQTIFGQGHVLDNLDMQLTYVFTGGLTSDVVAVLLEFDLLPRPSGVKLNLWVDPGSQFGFSPYYANFNNGSFGA